MPSMFRPRRTQEDRSVNLHKTGDRQSADQGECGRGKGCTGERAAGPVCERAEQAEVYEKLADKSVQRRQAADRHRPDHEAEGSPRHRLRQTPQMIDFAGVDGVDDGAGAQEQQGLEQGVVPDMQQTTTQTEDHQILAADRTADERQSQPNHDDSDVLDAMVRQQPLQIVLTDSKRHAKDARHHAQRQDDGTPGQRRSWHQGHYTDEAVHGDFDVDP